MRNLYASLLAMVASGATPLFAEPAELARDGCPLTAARNEVSTECAAL